ncbi:MAG: hypothetical protein LC772_05495, partial [Chloroflexi bacterium]|nr:hypothetical protein [Chloroflexota bacterium]
MRAPDAPPRRLERTTAARLKRAACIFLGETNVELDRRATQVSIRTPRSWRAMTQAGLLAVLMLGLSASALCAASAAAAAAELLPEPGARAIALPYPVVEGESFSVRIGWRLPPGAPRSTLHVELKDSRSQAVDFHLLPISAPGTVVMRFTAPPLSRTPTVQVVAWMGTDWRTPVALIWYGPQIWLESRQDANRAREQRAAWLADARRFFTGAPAGPASFTAALLDDSALSMTGHREARSVASELGIAGYHVMRVDANQVSNPFILNRSRVRLLVLTDAGRLPVDLGPALESFIHAGGNLAILGAPAWREAVNRIAVPQRVASLLKIPAGTRWIDTAQYDEATGHVPAQKLLSAFETGRLDGWRQNINPGAVPATYSMDVEAGQPTLHAVVADLTGWSTYSSPPLTAPFGPGQTLTSFRARGDGHTPRLSVEWAEKDGSRWIATVPLTDQWQNYSLGPDAFHFWPSVAGRGGRNDHLHPENASQVTVGLAFSHTGQTPGRHEWWLSGLGVST